MEESRGQGNLARVVEEGEVTDTGGVGETSNRTQESVWRRVLPRKDDAGDAEEEA